MVPGAEARGLVAPRRVRPVLTASRPSQTMAQMGPLSMSEEYVSQHVYLWDFDGKRTGDEAVEERLVLQVGIVGLEVLLAGSNELDGSELVAVIC